MAFWIRGTIVVILAATGLAGALRAKDRWLPDGETLPGLKVDGAVVTGDLEMLVRARANTILDREVAVAVDNDGEPLFRSKLRDLGVTVDVDAVVARARALGHSEDVFERARLADAARAGSLDLALAPSIDGTVIVQKLMPFKEDRDAAPVSARLDLDSRAVTPEHNGRYLDVYGGVSAVQAVAMHSDRMRVVVPLTQIAPQVTADYVRRIDVGTIVGEFETYFSRVGDQHLRGQNIDVGAQKLDGVVLSPGEVVSFNGIIGDRTEENGFKKSWEIFKGEMVEGVGGGTCQVASTLHAASMLAGLDIVERLPHSRPSAYIAMGLDATVVFPIVDLKLRNPHSFPLVIHAKTQGPKLVVQLLGKTKPVKVAFSRDVLETKAYTRKVEEDPRLTGTSVVVKQHGIRGYKVKRVRTIRYEDGTVKREENVDFYPPTTEVYEVPIGFDETKLPPLPPMEDDAETAQQSTETPQADPAVVLVNAPGAHNPTTAQVKPAKTLTLTR